MTPDLAADGQPGWSARRGHLDPAVLPAVGKVGAFSNPSSSTKNFSERSVSETGTNPVPTSLMPPAVASSVMLHSFT